MASQPLKRPFAKAVLEDVRTRRESAELDTKTLRTAQASIRLERWRRRKAPAAADEAGEQGGHRVDTSLKRPRDDG
jgi:hypothetical protein